MKPAMTAVGYLRSVDPATADAFLALRGAVAAAGPLDANTLELITLAGLATARNEGSFKTHARRLLGAGGDAAAIRQAVLVTLGASTTFAQVIEGLEWLDSVLAENAIDAAPK